MSAAYGWREIGRVQPADSRMAILGIPFDGAVSASRGAAEAPERIRQLSRILPPFSEEGIDLRNLQIFDGGDVAPTLDWERYFSQVEAQAAALLQQSPFGLFLGGDHSVTIPLFKAFARRHSPGSIGVVHLDSHCDLMDQYDGHGWSHACTQRRALEQGNMAPGHLALVGIRSFEAGELEFLAANPDVTVISARNFIRKGAREAIERVCAAMAGVSAVYLSLDIDVLDPAYAPGTGTPEGGGLSTRDVMELVGSLTRRLPVRAMDLVEVAPPLDCADITSWAALKIIYELFGALAPVK